MAGRTGRPKIGRKDENQEQIERALAAIGVVFMDTSGVGNGFNDLVCSIPEATWLLEVKMPGEKLTPAEKTWHRKCPWRNHVVWTADQATAIATYYRGRIKRPAAMPTPNQCPHGEVWGECSACQDPAMRSQFAP